jgi:hypothetical protein
MMKFASILLAAVMAASVAPAVAGERVRAVLELYTSQGCSSCPPADRLAAELARDPSLIVVTLPVDYWDYLGWRDTLANPAFTARQRAYSWIRGDRQVYTPQMVINGAAHAVGSENGAISNAIGSTAASPGILAVDVTIVASGANLTIDVGKAADGQAGHVWVIPIANSRQVAIKRGENQGRQISYVNVGLGLSRIGNWSGEATRIEVPAGMVPAQADGVVVLLQAGSDKKAGRVIGAARHSFASQ